MVASPSWIGALLSMPFGPAFILNAAIAMRNRAVAGAAGNLTGCAAQILLPSSEAAHPKTMWKSSSRSLVPRKRAEGAPQNSRGRYRCASPSGEGISRDRVDPGQLNACVKLVSQQLSTLARGQARRLRLVSLRDHVDRTLETSCAPILSFRHWLFWERPAPLHRRRIRPRSPTTTR